MRPLRIAVVGGGVAGLAAALRLRDHTPENQITVYEAGARPGGKLRTGSVAGRPVETGAEMFLARDPATGGPSAAVLLARRLGLGDDLVHPEPVAPAISVDGQLLPVPGGTLLGVPSDLSTLDGVAVAAVELDHDGGAPLLAPGEDVAVGAFVRRRLGDQVVDRLVDPMLGGVYAGRADDLSLATTMPGLAAACRERSTLVGAAAMAVAASRAQSGGPVFATVRGGLSRMVDALAARVDVRADTPITRLERAAGVWRVNDSTVDAVILAVPARPAARLLGQAIPLDYASVGLVTLALSCVDLPALSGFLVPATEGRAVKAATFFTTKWAHQRRTDGTVVVRASLGRYGESGVLQRPDADLVRLVVDELGQLIGRNLPAPVEAIVTRWGGALPQYAPGHLDRVRLFRAGLPPGLALAGAAYDGVGIPACIRSGQAAADAIVAESAP